MRMIVTASMHRYFCFCRQQAVLQRPPPTPRHGGLAELVGAGADPGSGRKLRSAIASPIVSQHPQRPDRGGTPPPREGQRRGHALAGRRGNAEASGKPSPPMPTPAVVLGPFCTNSVVSISRPMGCDRLLVAARVDDAGMFEAVFILLRQFDGGLHVRRADERNGTASSVRAPRTGSIRRLRRTAVPCRRGRRSRPSRPCGRGPDR